MTHHLSESSFNASTSHQLYLSEKITNYAPMVLGHSISSATPSSLSFHLKEPQTCLITASGLKFSKTTAILRYLARMYLPEWYELHHGHPSPEKSTTIDLFLHEVLHGHHPDVFQEELKKMNEYLKFRSFMVGYQVSLADFYLWGTLKAISYFQNLVKETTTVSLATSTTSSFPYLVRWYLTMESLPLVQKALSFCGHAPPSALQLTSPQQEAHPVTQERSSGSGSRSGSGSTHHHNPPTTSSTLSPRPSTSSRGHVTSHDPMTLTLPDAQVGQVVTRFPPEPSGYMHLGHAKAAMLNAYFAEKYEGTLIFRLDDTNPTTEHVHFEETIEEDLKALGIRYHRKTRTSDSFGVLMTYAEQLIRQGDAYVDDTDQETLRMERMKGVKSKHRDRSMESNLKAWKEMVLGTSEGLRCCLRAKMNYQDLNKALRDPVLYRCNLTPHHHTHQQYKVYPTYDFACPVVDSLEGVTHALRTNEYRDRNPQYQWVLTHLNLRPVHVWDFSRLNFVYTLLSKRKLAWFVQHEKVQGWDDPRFPTLRGLLRRGLTVSALRDFILLQGASTKTMLLEWDKLWNLNKKQLDPRVPRYTVIEQPVLVYLENGPVTPYAKSILKHKKQPHLGTKVTMYAKEIYIEAHDTVGLKVGEEITLMDWGNAVVTEIHPTRLHLRLHLEGDVKSTTKKWTWLSTQHVVGVYLKEYDFLITKKKLDATDDFAHYLNPTTESTQLALGDFNLLDLPLSSHVQFERKGFYILDPVFTQRTEHTPFPPSPSMNTTSVREEEETTTRTPSSSCVLVFNAIPDGKQASVSLKHGTPSPLHFKTSSVSNPTLPPTLPPIDLLPFFSKKNKKESLSQENETTLLNEEAPVSSLNPSTTMQTTSRSKSKSRSRSRSRSRSKSRSNAKG
ncbi:hypothetical protein HMI54_013720 [Coelomomyces lativittatus]|nr:hypothetical protein HMI56_003780 [Coelomomyces lativittatus]KAJ1517788.1 hypothetical protein HMI55_005939 [Coelomomyces lativittatus]KAJ1518635.1 hypothetical protein HMI54_013720 [Coelomomyces lativittatus]